MSAPQLECGTFTELGQGSPHADSLNVVTGNSTDAALPEGLSVLMYYQAEINEDADSAVHLTWNLQACRLSGSQQLSRLHTAADALRLGAEWSDLQRPPAAGPGQPTSKCHTPAAAAAAAG